MNQNQKDILDFKKGLIVRCGVCGKIDINPLTHYYECNPEYEAYRQEQIDHDWK